MTNPAWTQTEIVIRTDGYLFICFIGICTYGYLFICFIALFFHSFNHLFIYFIFRLFCPNLQRTFPFTWTISYHGNHSLRRRDFVSLWVVIFCPSRSETFYIVWHFSMRQNHFSSWRITFAQKNTMFRYWVCNTQPDTLSLVINVPLLPLPLE